MEGGESHPCKKSDQTWPFRNTPIEDNKRLPQSPSSPPSSLAHSATHLLTHSPSHPVTQSLTHPLTHLLPD